MPFFGTGFHTLRRKARKIGVRLIATSPSTIRSTLCSQHKHHLPKEQESGVVYCIQCSCQSIYVGETGRELQDRVCEHEHSWKAGTTTSAFGEHQSCQPAFEDTIILHREQHHRLRLLAESAFIHTLGKHQVIMESPQDASLNRNAGILVDDIWFPLLCGDYKSTHRHQT